VKGRATVIVFLAVDVGTVPKKDFHNLTIPLEHGIVERCTRIGSTDILVRSMIEQQSQNLMIEVGITTPFAMLNGDMERRALAEHVLVDIGPVREPPA
jgi:hypothetical protein